MKKATLPIGYIVALIFGVIAIGILGYWFFIQSGRTIGAGVEAECEAKQRTFCQLWKATNWKVKPPEPDWGACEPYDETKCKQLLGEKVTGTPTQTSGTTPPSSGETYPR